MKLFCTTPDSDQHWNITTRY